MISEALNYLHERYFEVAPLKLPKEPWFEVKRQDDNRTVIIDNIHNYDEFLVAAKRALWYLADSEVLLMEPFKVILRREDYRKLVPKQTVVVLRKGEQIDCTLT